MIEEFSFRLKLMVNNQHLLSVKCQDCAEDLPLSYFILATPYDVGTIILYPSIKYEGTGYDEVR